MNNFFFNIGFLDEKLICDDINTYYEKNFMKVKKISEKSVVKRISHDLEIFYIKQTVAREILLKIQINMTVSFIHFFL